MGNKKTHISFKIPVTHPDRQKLEKLIPLACDVQYEFGMEICEQTCEQIVNILAKSRLPNLPPANSQSFRNGKHD